MWHRPTDPQEGTSSRRLIRVNLASAVAFIVGGSLFALGAAFAQRGVVDLLTVNVTYLVGGVFFSLGAFSSILLAVNAPTDREGHHVEGSMRWWTYEPRRRDWRSAVVLFIGTLLFAVSLVAAFAEGLTPRQSNGWIWLPDMLGCLCFLLSGHLAMLEVGGGHVAVHVHELDWWVVAINQLGSILFVLAGLAAFTRPTTSSVLNAGLVNWGTFAGAVCFAVGGLLQVFIRPTSTRTVVQHTP